MQPPSPESALPDRSSTPAGSDRRIASVWELTTAIKEQLQITFPFVWVAGEVSNVTRPQSGHVYFVLKDSQAQIRAVMWRSTASRLRFELQDGMQVVCGASVDVYPPRGSYQLAVRQIEPQGEGALQLALRQLQQRLAAEGLFAASRKQALPRFPRFIAVVTSPTGAAIRDFLEALRRRWQGGQVLVIPARVQGAEAASEIVRGVRTAHQLAERPDVLVVCRGGGSLEDLWSFNEETVVRAISNATIPVVSAVGHEIDVTLSDLVADARALTPTAAADFVAPPTDELAATVRAFQQRLVASLRSRAAAARNRLTLLGQRRVFRRPLDRLQDLTRRLDDLELRSSRAIRTHHSSARAQLGSLAARLDSLSPLSVLARGYSLTERARDGQLVLDASSIEVGDRIITRLAHGRLTSAVEEISETATATTNVKQPSE